MLMTFDARESWLLNRRKFIGSSDAGVLWGPSACYASQSLYSLYCQKAHGQEWQPSKSELRRLRKGQLLEPYIREIAEDELGVELHVDPPHSFRVRGVAAASLDSYCVGSWSGADGLLTIPVELKHVGPHNAHEWDDGATPLKYQVQLLHQLMVLDAPYGYVCGLCDDELFVRRPERDLEWEALHAARCEEFMARVRGELPPPEPDGGPATTEAIKHRWKRERGPRVDVGDWLDESAAKLEELKATAKQTKEQIDALENRIRDAIGEAEGCISPSGVEFTWTTQERKEYTVAASSSRVLRRTKRKAK